MVESNERILTFRNTHDAILAERRLLDSGIDARVMPMPTALGKACGITFRVAEGELALARAVLGDTLAAVYRPHNDVNDAKSTSYDKIE